jgi:hypothetical protein
VLVNNDSIEWRCILGCHHRWQRPKLVHGFHPELTEPKIVATCPPNSPKPCNPCKSPLLTTTTSVGDRTKEPHSAGLQCSPPNAQPCCCSRRQLATAHPGPSPRYPLIRRRTENRRRRCDRPPPAGYTLLGTQPQPHERRNGILGPPPWPP